MIRKLITRCAVASYLPPNPFDGEMLPLERIRLYQWLMEFKPSCVLEVGTGVGGSTFYISEALKRNGGQLHTCDPERGPPDRFLKRFADQVKYHPVKSKEMIDQLIQCKIYPDFLFFDGPEVPELAIEDLRRLEPHLKSGCMFAMHDWEQPGGKNRRIVSIKAAKIRPYMESSPCWQRVDCLSGHTKNVWWTKGKYDSVGLCLYRYQGCRSSYRLAA